MMNAPASLLTPIGGAAGGAGMHCRDVTRLGLGGA